MDKISMKVLSCENFLAVC